MLGSYPYHKMVFFLQKYPFQQTGKHNVEQARICVKRSIVSMYVECIFIIQLFGFVQFNTSSLLGT